MRGMVSGTVAKWCVRTGLAALLAFGAAVQAGTTCKPAEAPGMDRCVSGLPSTLITTMVQDQQAGEASWTAGMALILRRYGLEIAGAQIAAHSQPARFDAGSAQALLHGSWRDGMGRQVDASVSLVAAPHHEFGIRAPEVLHELDEGRPMLLSVRQQALVLVQLVYDRPRGNVADLEHTRIVRAVVLDPAAPSLLRTLRPAEWQPEVLARIAVRGADTLRSAHEFRTGPGERAAELAAARP